MLDCLCFCCFVGVLLQEGLPSEDGLFQLAPRLPSHHHMTASHDSITWLPDGLLPLLLFKHRKQSSLFTYLPHLSFLWKSAPLLCKSFIHSTLLERQKTSFRGGGGLRGSLQEDLCSAECGGGNHSSSFRF